MGYFVSRGNNIFLSLKIKVISQFVDLLLIFCVLSLEVCHLLTQKCGARERERETSIGREKERERERERERDYE